MSLALYRIRLFWNGRQGAARIGSRTCRLFEAPDLAAGPISEIDYAPEVDLAQCRPAGRDWRAMSAAEIAAADLFLAELAAPQAA